MAVDYARLAAQHGGTVVEDDEPDYSGLASMQPMVAHTPRGQAVDYAKLAAQHGGEAVDEEPQVINYRGLRIARNGETSPAPTKEEKAALLKQTAGVGTAAAVLGTAGVASGIPAVVSAGGTALHVLGNPYVAGGISGVQKLYETGDPIEAGKAAVKGALYGKIAGVAAEAAPTVLQFIRAPKSLIARVAHQIVKAGTAVAPEATAAAEAAPTIAKAAAPVAEAATADIEGLVQTMKDTAAPMQARTAARATLEKALSPDKLQEVVSLPSAARKIAPIPASGSLAERQAALAKAAGMDVGEVFGAAAPKAAAPAADAEQAVETALETRLRASVLMKKNPKALTDEVVDRVVSIKKGVGKGLSAAQVAKSMEELYGFPPVTSRNIVDMTFREFGLK